MWKETDNLLGILDQIYPYLAGISLVTVAGLKLWWYSRQELKRRISAVEMLAENNDENSQKMILELRELRRSNDEQHDNIMDKVIALFNGRQQ